MIQHIKLLLEYKGEEKFTMSAYKLGYQLYGYICDILDDSTVEEFHKSQVTPLSQYFIKGENENCFEWNIFIFGDNLNEIDEKIKIDDIINITKYNLSFKVISKEKSIIYQKDFCKEYILGDNLSRVKKIRFFTPCSFKSNGEYMIFPSSRLILNSAISKWNTFFNKYAIEDEEAVEQIVNSCRIERYNLKTLDFVLKDVKITGFVGEVTLKLTGTQRIIALDNMLLDFLEYSGVGIKSALGMGACTIVK